MRIERQMRAAETVAATIRQILADQARLDPAALGDNARLADLGLDSLALVETLFAIEESFDISVPFNANDPAQSADDLATVGALIATVQRLIAAR